MSNSDPQDAILARALALGIDPNDHRCDCEVCRMTSALCTASVSSLEMEMIERAQAAKDRQARNRRKAARRLARAAGTGKKVVRLEGVRRMRFELELRRSLGAFKNAVANEDTLRLMRKAARSVIRKFSPREMETQVRVVVERVMVMNAISAEPENVCDVVVRYFVHDREVQPNDLYDALNPKK